MHCRTYWIRKSECTQAREDKKRCSRAFVRLCFLVFLLVLVSLALTLMMRGEVEEGKL